MIDKILNGKYGDIFPIRDETKIEAYYREYCKLIHPDKNKDPRATEAFMRLGQLKESAIQALHTGEWEEQDTIRFEHISKKRTLFIQYLYHHTTDVCDYYVTEEHIIYTFHLKRKKYYDNFIHWLKYPYKYANPEMRLRFEPMLPHSNAELFETVDKYIVNVPKATNIYPLRAVIDNIWSGKVPDRHWAWITSRLMELVNFLHYNDIVLNGFDLDALFVSLDNHQLYLYGGWWFATKTDEKLIGTTSKIWANMPPRAKASHIGDPITDIESIKLMGRTYCDTPPDALTYFFQSGSGDSYNEWEKWEKAIQKAYGERKFIKITATKEEIYNKE